MAHQGGVVTRVRFASQRAADIIDRRPQHAVFVVGRGLVGVRWCVGVFH